ncbi:YeeE/YedE family protein [Amorphus orientalis]|uniref:Membrane protein YedE/YeeE n=1 Tax=Amorphus orientalis TaxID=649198 RepID=A0AAE3VM34_9HYPH|nr:putative membrane protein YedE/YeeE [Amorphus orientalis]
MPLVATEFTPWSALAGGVLIGLSSVMLMLFFGRIAGIIGVVARAVSAVAVPAIDRNWRIAFIVGLFAAPLTVMAITGSPVEQTVSDNLPLMAFAGLLVGFGTALGFGCTSGHGVCGLARLSRRSMVSVAVFMGAAIATVYILRHATGVL